MPCCSPEFLDAVDPERAPGVIGGAWSQASGRDLLDVLLSVDVRTYLPEDLLVKMDIATMAHSLEARSPFLDPEVMEFAASVPPRYKGRFRHKKWLLRRAYRGRLPDRTLDAAKQGFAVPIEAWLRNGLGSYAREVLLDPATLGRGIVREASVESKLRAHRAGDADWSGHIWALLMLELSLRELG